jgi:hypothetical protein
VVGALPAHWLDPAGQQVLRRLVAQAVICERREARLRELRAQGQDGSEVSRDAGPKVDEAPKSRPWEIQARG